ncbi:MAG: hypothetical protein K2X81_10595, partial [Candidatus Obscuribacterales bacterium]|nr:hypothetical protein [Candidatus Obscuribacterales bacterium]
MAKRLIANVLILLMTLWAPLQAFAQSAPETHLDLSSTSQTLSSSSLFDGQASQTATIQVGGASMEVTAGQLLTPAQFLALSQVLSSGSQSLHLSTDGMAIGGSFS